jgi:hypothetical protein
MRLWSLHPKYLDARGLVALWREGLLALEVLKGTTKGYRNHPQLQRFKEQKDPVASIKHYLWHVYEESLARGYHFNPARIMKRTRCPAINVTRGQLQFERMHLGKKLAVRDPRRIAVLQQRRTPLSHPLFRAVGGPKEAWEKQE